LPLKASKAFAPAAISSFFEICDQTSSGNPITDNANVGARGGGFGLQKGVLTEVKVSPSETSRIHISINAKAAPEAKTTKTVLQALLTKAEGDYEIFVDHTIKVPVGVGFGTSAGGALTAGLALAKALKLPLTYNQIGRIAHNADVECKTGLGTVTPLTFGGSCILVLEPGAPGIGRVDRILVNPNYVIVAGIVRETSTKSVLSDPKKRLEVNYHGKKTLEAILAEPSVENFIACCWEFAQKTGFATEKVKQLVQLAEKAGAVGAAQNMIGEVVHALVTQEKAANVAEAFKQVLPKQNVFVSKLDFEGARLVN
jgi:pantoate kinase